MATDPATLALIQSISQGGSNPLPPNMNPYGLTIPQVPNVGSRLPWPQTIGPHSSYPRLSASTADDLLRQAGTAGVGAVDDVARGGLLAGARSAIPSSLPSILSKGARLGGKGTLGLGLATGVAGEVLGNAAGGNDSGLGRFLKGAGTGAGIGAGAGLLGGPLAPVSSTAGAIIGGTVGGLGNLIFGGDGDKKGKSSEELSELLTNSGLPEPTVNRLNLTYKVLKEVDPDNADAAFGQLILEEVQAAELDEVEQKNQYEKMLASQALAAEFFQPFAKQMLDSAQLRFNSTQGMIDQLPESYRGIAHQQNAASLDIASRMATAYQAQAQLIPAAATIQNQVSLMNQLSQQQLMQALSAQNGGGGSANADSLASLVQQLQSQGG